MSSKFYLELKTFILTRSLSAYDDEYWISVVKGLMILLWYRDAGLPKPEEESICDKVRIEISELGTNRFIEDLSDEMVALLIGSYPMPYFWNSTLKDYREHNNFKKYFDLLQGNSAL